MSETELIASYRAAEAELDRLQIVVMEHFMPQADAALARNDPEGARRVALTCPDIVARAFIFDAIRQHGKS